MSTENKSLKLLTWMAANRDPQFLGNVIYALEKLTDKKVSTVYYLYGGKEKDIDEIQKVLSEVKDFCKENELTLNSIDTGIFDPDDLKQVLNHAIKALVPKLDSMGDVCISISSGTSTMTAVWLFLKSLNFFKGRATFYQAKKYTSQVERSNDVFPRDEQPIKRLDFGGANKLINTIMQEESRKNPNGGLNDTFLGKGSNVELRKKAFERIQQFANIDNVPMLILGERGVGKSAAVKTLIGDIKKKKVVEAACGAMDSNLAESMLFGYVKGAFTDAKTDQDGLFDEANGSILFLDEIQDLPRNTQRKLLRTIQEKDHPYRPVGSTKDKHANCQLIFASNNTMEQLYEKLDPDFFDRIKMFTVYLPPLRECGDDIKNDWQAVWTSCRPHGLQNGGKKPPVEAPSPDVIWDFLKDPINLEGNIRSLQKLAYQIIAWQVWDDPNEIKKILDELHQENIEAHNCLQKIKRKSGDAENLDTAIVTDCCWDDAVKSFKESLAVRTVKSCGMSIPRAAQKLGCDKNTISKALPEKFRLQLKQGKA